MARSRGGENGFPRIPKGTVRYGRLWTADGVFLARYSEARLANGHTYPVCLAIGPEEGLEGSKPGAVISRRAGEAFTVHRWSCVWECRRGFTFWP